jgi:hypothetical protein
MKREVQGKKFWRDQWPAIQNFQKWVEHCKKCITCQGRYFEKENITAPPQSSNSKQ